MSEPTQLEPDSESTLGETGEETLEPSMDRRRFLGAAAAILGGAYVSSSASDASQTGSVAQAQYNSGRTGYTDSSQIPISNIGTEWTFEMDGASKAEPVISDGTAYIGSNDGNLYAINTETGEEEWRFNTNETVQGAPAISEEIVAFGNSNGRTFAANKETGEKKWSKDTGGYDVAIENGEFYVISPRDMAKFNSQGEEMWYKEISPVEDGIAVKNGKVYIGTGGGQLEALDTGTGETDFTVDIGEEISIRGVVASDYEVLVSGDDNLHVLDLSGNIKHSLNIPGSPASPIITGNGVKVISSTSNDYDFAAVSNESIDWTADSTFQGVGSAAAGDIAVFANKDLEAYSISTGERLWKYESAAGQWISKVHVADDAMFAVGDQGFVEKLTGDLPNTPKPTTTETSTATPTQTDTPTSTATPTATPTQTPSENTTETPGAIKDDFGPATDPDNDGDFEDINGDGKTSLADITAFFNNYDKPKAQDPSFFDFNKDGKVTLADVTRFFKQYTG